MRNYLASIVSAALWTSILTAIPFVEQSLDSSPSANDSWQRGLVWVPVMFLFAILGAHTVARWAIVRGDTSFIRFTLRASVAATGICSLALIPSGLVAGLIGFGVWPNILTGGASIVAMIFLSCLPAAGFWWLIGITAHNKSLQPTAGGSG